LLRLFLMIRYPAQKKILWFFEPFHVAELLWLFDSYRLVYDCVDYYPGFNAHAKRQHDVLMGKSHFVFANSKSLAKELQKTRLDVVSVPLGFADELFAKTKVRSIPPNKTPFVAGYIGSISDRIDFSLLERTVNGFPTIKFLFVGPLEHDVFDRKDDVPRTWQRILKLPNIEWMGAVPKESIPNVLQRMDVGLIPYRTDLVFNVYSFPLKTMEYFAAGLPVITSDIHELRQYARRGLVKIVGNSKEMMRAIQEIQRYGWSKVHQGTQRGIASRNSWEEKIERILATLKEEY